MSIEQLNTSGAWVALTVLVSSIAVFSLRLASLPEAGKVAGVPALLMAVPLVWLLLTAPSHERPLLYYVQVTLMLAWLLVLFLADYWPGFDVRANPATLIGFVVLYFAGIGGMVGVASTAGRAWMAVTVVLFFVAGILAFVSRSVTGV